MPNEKKADLGVMGIIGTEGREVEKGKNYLLEIRHQDFLMP
jgi:hypothetical protein